MVYTILIINNICLCASLGDSRAVLCDSSNKAIRISKDHKPIYVDEINRIEKLGGRVINSRVNGFGVSRALGDFAATPFIGSTPYLKEFVLDNTEKFIILACDGIWDELEDEEAVEIVLNELSNNDTRESLSRICCTLRDYAFSCGSKDNITCVIIKLSKK